MDGRDGPSLLAQGCDIRSQSGHRTLPLRPRARAFAKGIAWPCVLRIRDTIPPLTVDVKESRPTATAPSAAEANRDGSGVRAGTPCSAGNGPLTTSTHRGEALDEARWMT